MSPLRSRFCEYMILRGFSPRTHESYLHAMIELARYYRRSPDQLSNEEIQAFLIHVITVRHHGRLLSCDQRAPALRGQPLGLLAHYPIMNTAHLRVADVFRQHWAEYDRTQTIAPHQRNIVRHILTCRTAALGGHLHRCEHCGTEVPLYNPCLDRHCPTCQTLSKQDWLEDRHAELLPVQYFHTVFTLPHNLNPLIDANRPLLLGELFSVVNWVLQHFAADPQWRLEGQVRFSYRDHADGNRLKAMDLPAAEFIKRFLYHILPSGFQKARYYGWLSSTNKKKTMAAIRRVLSAEPPSPPPEESPVERILRLTGVDVRRCPVCGQPTLTYVRVLLPTHARGPP